MWDKDDASMPSRVTWQWEVNGGSLVSGLERLEKRELCGFHVGEAVLPKRGGD